VEAEKMKNLFGEMVLLGGTDELKLRLTDLEGKIHHDSTKPEDHVCIPSTMLEADWEITVEECEPMMMWMTDQIKELEPDMFWN
jgi:hypothetical protein